MKVYKYVQVADYQAAIYLKLQSLDEFSRFLDQYQYKQILVLPQTEKAAKQFAVVHNGALVAQDTTGFQLLEDYHVATKGGFPSAKSYYEGATIGCTVYSDYETAIKSGTKDFRKIVRMREGGFIEGFSQMQEIKASHPAAAVIEAATASQLYEWAMTAGFASFAEMKEALGRGFTEASVYKVAMEKGYTNADDFRKGVEGKYLNATEWKEAQQIGAKDREDYAHYHELNLLDLPNLKHDEKCVLVLVSKLPQHKKVSANKFRNLLAQQIDSYRYSDTNELPSWFATAFTNDYTCIDFLQKSEEARRYGSYDKDGEYFETRELQERKVVIDGSNVAYSLRKTTSDSPTIANIIRVVESLKERGFTEIIVMSDASLVRRLGDSANLPALKEMVTYIQTPAEKPADVFLIEYVKIHRCLLLSNDTFRDWKLKEAWIAENIDYYRLSFVLSEDAVLLPDLDSEKVK